MKPTATWNEIWAFDLDDVKKLWHASAIDTATRDDAMIDYTTTFPTHIAARWAALARCAAAWSARYGGAS